MFNDRDTFLSRATRAVVAGGVALALTLGSYGLAEAASSGAGGAAHGGLPPGPLVPRPAGTVTSIGASSITVSSANGDSEAFTTTSSTIYRKDGRAATSAVVAVGSIVAVVVAPTSGSSQPTATEIDVRSPSLTGTVVSLAGGSITIEDPQGFWRTIDTSSSTSYELGGAPAGASAVGTGERVMALGSVDADHSTLDASEVDVLLPTVAGEVSALSGDTITLDTRSRTVTVTTSAATVYERAGASSSASAVKKGSFIVAEGERHGASALSATSIDVAPFGPGARPSAAKAGTAFAPFPGPGLGGPAGPGGPGF